MEYQGRIQEYGVFVRAGGGRGGLAMAVQHFNSQPMLGYAHYSKEAEAELMQACILQISMDDDQTGGVRHLTKSSIPFISCFSTMTAGLLAM